MGKTKSLKNRVASVHSRAAKRASSPGINLDKSVKKIKAPSFTKSLQPSVLAIHHGAGVVKKSNNRRKSVLSSKARRRHQKGLDYAETILDKTEKKIERSKNKAKTIHERCKNWEELNENIILPKKSRRGDPALSKITAMEVDPSSNTQKNDDPNKFQDRNHEFLDSLVKGTASVSLTLSPTNHKKDLFIENFHTRRDNLREAGSIITSIQKINLFN